METKNVYNRSGIIKYLLENKPSCETLLNKLSAYNIIFQNHKDLFASYFLAFENNNMSLCSKCYFTCNRSKNYTIKNYFINRNTNINSFCLDYDPVYKTESDRQFLDSRLSNDSDIDNFFRLDNELFLNDYIFDLYKIFLKFIIRNYKIKSIYIDIPDNIMKFDKVQVYVHNTIFIKRNGLIIFRSGYNETMTNAIDLINENPIMFERTLLNI